MKAVSEISRFVHGVTVAYHTKGVNHSKSHKKTSYCPINNHENNQHIRVISELFFKERRLLMAHVKTKFRLLLEVSILIHSTLIKEKAMSIRWTNGNVHFVIHSKGMANWKEFATFQHTQTHQRWQSGSIIWQLERLKITLLAAN